LQFRKLALLLPRFRVAFQRLMNRIDQVLIAERLRQKFRRVFPNSIGGFMDYENFEARQLDPIREKLGLPKLNFQVLRRTFATRAYGEKMGTLKDVQMQLRHTRPDTTLENYVKDIPDSVYQMVDLMYDEITRTREQSVRVDQPAPPEVGREALAEMAVVGACSEPRN
jgi:integrase